MVDLFADAGKRGARGAACFEGEADADDLEGVSNEHRCYARDCAADKATQGRLLTFVLDEDGAHLLVRKELDGSIGEDA